MSSEMLSAIISVPPDNAFSNGTISYLIGGIIALLILAYLAYSLSRPEKF